MRTEAGSSAGAQPSTAALIFSFHLSSCGGQKGFFKGQRQLAFVVLSSAGINAGQKQFGNGGMVETELESRRQARRRRGWSAGPQGGPGTSALQPAPQPEQLTPAPLSGPMGSLKPAER